MVRVCVHMYICLIGKIFHGIRLLAHTESNTISRWKSFVHLFIYLMFSSHILYSRKNKIKHLNVRHAICFNYKNGSLHFNFIPTLCSDSIKLYKDSQWLMYWRQVLIKCTCISMYIHISFCNINANIQGTFPAFYLPA